MAELLERAVAVREVLVRVPAETATKTFADIGNLLTTSVSAGLIKYRDSIHLMHTIQSQEQHNNTPNKRFTRWNLDLDPFPPDVDRSFLPECTSYT